METEVPNVEEVQEIQEIQKTTKPKNKPFVPKYDSARYDKDTGKYSRKPLDPQYFNKYYHENNIMVPCLYCSKMVGKMKMQRHLKTKYCMARQPLLLPETSIPSESPAKPPKPSKYVENFEDKVINILEKHLEKLKI
jgi:hypothetical protein